LKRPTSCAKPPITTPPLLNIRKSSASLRTDKIAQDAQYWIGQTYFEAGQFDAALSAFEKLLDEYPTSKIIPSTKLMIERAEQAKDANLFLKAIKKGDIERIKKLISQGADVNAKDNRGMTPLHKAAYYGRRQIAKVLIAKGANVNGTDTAGQTPLHIAANFGAKFVPELLLANGAQVNARDNTGNTPLHDAAGYWCVKQDLLELLLAKGADVNARNEAGQTPLHRVSMIRRQASEIPAEVLLAHGAEVDAKDKSGNTPIHFAVKNGHGKLIDLLLSKRRYHLQKMTSPMKKHRLMRSGVTTQMSSKYSYTMEPTSTRQTDGVGRSCIIRLRAARRI